MKVPADLTACKYEELLRIHDWLTGQVEEGPPPTVADRDRSYAVLAAMRTLAPPAWQVKEAHQRVAAEKAAGRPQPPPAASPASGASAVAGKPRGRRPRYLRLHEDVLRLLPAIGIASPVDVLVLMVILLAKRNDEHIARTSIRAISEKLGLPYSTVRHAVTRWESRYKLIRYERRERSRGQFHIGMLYEAAAAHSRGEGVFWDRAPDVKGTIEPELIHGNGSDPVPPSDPPRVDQETYLFPSAGDGPGDPHTDPNSVPF